MDIEQYLKYVSQTDAKPATLECKLRYPANFAGTRTKWRKLLLKGWIVRERLEITAFNRLKNFADGKGIHVWGCRYSEKDKGKPFDDLPYQNIGMFWGVLIVSEIKDRTTGEDYEFPLNMKAFFDNFRIMKVREMCLVSGQQTR